MKLIFAIINDEYAAKVTDALHSAKFIITRLSSTGSFLSVGNTTLLIVVEDSQVDSVIEIIKDNSKKRKAPSGSSIRLGSFHISSSKDVAVSGATIFVTHVERFEKE